MTEIKLQLLPNGQISCEIEGEKDDIAKMICMAMIGNVEVASIICGAIPSFLDERGLSREGYCKRVMEAQGNRGEKK